MKHLCFLVAALGTFVVALAMPAAVQSAPPSNDNFADATAITSMPFTATVDITEATVEPGEPIGAVPGPIGRTVWYSFAPTADAVAQVGPPFSPPDPSVPPTLCDLRSMRFLVVYRADSATFAGLVPIAGDQWSSARIYTLQVQAGTTYYVQGGQNGDLSCGKNSFSLSVSIVPPPPNDNFANAIAFTSVPYSDSRDLTGATVELGEPMACGSSFNKSAWYAFTPTTSGAYGGFGVSNVNVYTGTSLSNLTNVACADWPGLYFHADVGTTYYLQIYGDEPRGVRVDVVPPPAADFTYSPGDPSVLEEVSFSYWNGGYWDPTVTGYSWDFGDGTTATGSPVPHKFAKDGDFTVTITVHARGGRMNTATKIVQVRPDDTPPVITAPANLNVPAMSQTGATVSYEASAIDAVDGSVPVTCSPASGSLFTIGDTTVECSAADAAGNVAETSFTVHVRGASEQLVGLMETVAGLGRPATPELKGALNRMLAQALDAVNAGRRDTACRNLALFIETVNLVTPNGPRLTREQAALLTRDARRIRGVIGC